MELLKVNDLVCGYNGKEIIKGISFSVSEGEFLGVIGPNGAGKTTLLKVLTRILKPYGGNILYCGRNISDLSAGELAREIAVLPQILEIPFSFTVEELVLMGRFPHLKRMERPKPHDLEVVEKVMEQAEVLPFRKRKINQLSGGERQRVLFAQALAQEPHLFLLDEPVSHLDIKHQVEILDLLKRLNKGKLTVVAILHDLNLASEYCKQIVLLDNGHINKTGKPGEVLTYQTIEEVYKTVVLVKENPISGKPHVLLVPEENRKEML
jgi:iron complex transport system ATP-binding protein